MDPYRRRVLDRGPDEQWEPVRRAMGVARRLADKVELAAMKPNKELASSGYCLVNPGKEYLAYLPNGSELTIDLSTAVGSMTVEWIDPHSGNAKSAPPVSGGAARVLKAPAQSNWVVHVHSLK
jgi:hypothetical protein